MFKRIISSFSLAGLNPDAVTTLCSPNTALSPNIGKQKRDERTKMYYITAHKLSYNMKLDLLVSHRKQA
jgi:hypothetical protein